MKYVLFVTLSIFIPLVGAQAGSLIESLTLEDRVIYYETLSMCEQTTNDQYAEKASIWYQSFINSGLIDTILNKKFSLKSSPFQESPKINHLTSSIGFFYAIDKCFGTDENAKSLFFISLLSLDTSAKLAAWVVDLSLLRPLFWGVKAAVVSTDMTSLELARRYFWFRIFFSQVYKQMTFMKVQIFKILTPIILSASAGEAYSYYREMRDKSNILSGKTPERIEELEREIDSFKEQIAKTRKQSEIDDLNLFIEQNKKMIKNLRS